ncbi:MAG TPA: transcriptional repressor LexA [bacterium]|nr:transcriptional repressor LexA [bacterium]
MAPSDEPLTDIQRSVLKYVQDHLMEDHRPPTVREVMRHFKWNSPQSARKHLLALEEKGYLEREDRTARGLRVVEDSSVGISIPVLGKVAAGLPLLAEENRESTMVVDPSMARGGRNLFALTVRGDSMLNAHILPGDKVIVQQTTHATPGDIVVALIEGEATVKTFKKRSNLVVLEPANPKYEPIVVNEKQDFRIIGKVVGVFSPR